MKKELMLIFSIILVSGCSIIDESNETLSNITQDISKDLTQGVNDSIGGFVSGLINDSSGFIFVSPVSEFTSQDMALLGIDCVGSDEQIAQCIKDWQAENIDYDPSKPDSSYTIRWNYAFPGLYPSNEIIKEKVSGGRIYGICVDYALIYCSIADYYGLTCRVSNSLTKPSDKNPELLEYSTGLGMEEYNDLIVKLRRKGMDYPYELIRQIMKETPEHYWPEVYLNGEWVIYDATNILVAGSDTKANYVDKNDWQVTVWENNNTESLLSSYVPKIDDLGQTSRSWTIDDYFGSKMSGQAIPVPYYDSCNDVCAFFQGRNPMCAFECPISQSFYSCYESCSGNNFYKICDFICNDEEPGFADCYLECSKEELNAECFDNC